jgi:DNA-binding LacI/PurR family transcriptional regulator
MVVRGPWRGGRRVKDSSTVRDRRPTLEDVAAKAGVSRALVSLALNDSPRVAPASRELILRAAAEIGYRPNLAARNLASHRTGTVGVLLNDLHNPYFADVFDGLAAAAADANLKLLLTTGRNLVADELKAINSMLEHRVDGVILVGARVATSEISAVAKTLPTVLIGRTVRNQAVDCVTNNEAEGARIAVEHLVSLGHRTIVHIDGGGGAGAAARRAGFQRAGQVLGVHTEVVSGEYTEAAGILGAKKLLRRRSLPTAVFGANDLVAIGALDAFLDAGLRVPEDVSVLGYDNSAIARMSRVSLTSIDQSAERLGGVAIDLLRSRLAGRIEQGMELVTPTLIRRRTTAPPHHRPNR